MTMTARRPRIRTWRSIWQIWMCTWPVWGSSIWSFVALTQSSLPISWSSKNWFQNSFRLSSRLGSTAAMRSSVLTSLSSRSFCWKSLRRFVGKFSTCASPWVSEGKVCSVVNACGSFGLGNYLLLLRMRWMFLVII